MFPPKDSRLIEHEVAPLPGLTPAESSLLDLHSLLNATQVLMGELNLAGFILADDPELLVQSLRACHGWVTHFQDRTQALANARQFPQLRAQVMSEVHRQSAAHPGPAASPDFAAVPTNLASIFAIIAQRIDELLAREGHELRWTRFPAVDLRRNLVVVFAAMERNIPRLEAALEAAIRGEEQAAELARLRAVAREAELLAARQAAAEEATRAAQAQQAQREEQIRQAAAATARAAALAEVAQRAAPAPAPTPATAPTEPPEREDRALIHRAILADLEDLGIPTETAKRLIAAIARGQVFHLAITY